MLRNFLTTALRNLRRRRSYTIINIAGLALGITCSLLIFVLVRFHLSMDTYHARAGRTYRIVSDLHFGNLIQTAGVPYPFGEAFRQDFPEIETAGQIRFVFNNLVTTGGTGNTPKKKFLLERELGYAEPEFFDVLDYQWLKGNKEVLREPFQAVITRRMASKFFGTADPIGQIIRIENVHDYKVAGLLEDLAPNTDFKPEVFLSYKSYWIVNNPEHLTKWNNVSSNHQCYVVLPEGLQPKQIAQRLPAFVRKYQEEPEKWEHKLQPLSDVYFNTDYSGDVPKTIIWALVVVGLFLLGTACINFINLATAQAINRSREVGVRKVLGGSRWQLFLQFLVETGAITLSALVLSAIVVHQAIPFINDLTHSNIPLNQFGDINLLLFLCGMLLAVTLLAGTYPALILAGFQPVQAIKGRINTQTLGGYSIRRGLVVSQFVIAQVMIIAAIVITAQLGYLKNTSLGFNKEALVVLPVPNPEKSSTETLRQKLLAIPGVQAVCFGQDAPAGSSQNSSSCRFDSRQEEEVWYINTLPCDDQYLGTYGLRLAAGRNLRPGDTIREFLLNETAVKKLGFSAPEEVVGKSFEVWGKQAPIVGVVRDFHNQSLHEPIQPMVMMSSLKDFVTCGVKIDLSNTPHILAAMDNAWNGVFPDDFYSYTFLDDKVARFYEMEHALLGLTQFFCGVALFIGCLGLYGLISFMAARKQKEIGIRKILGASVAQILGLFGKEFIRLVLIAFVLAAPLGWWAMQNWLQDYPYRISLGVSVFLGTLGGAMLLALVTVSLQSLKAALAHPSESLRSE